MNTTITTTEDHRGGSFELHLEDEVIGKMTFAYAGASKIIIDHTEVNPDHNGKGYGKLLMKKAIEYATEKDIKIIPMCSFAKSYFDKHPELNDLLFNS